MHKERIRKKNTKKVKILPTLRRIPPSHFSRRNFKPKWETEKGRITEEKGGDWLIADDSYKAESGANSHPLLLLLLLGLLKGERESLCFCVHTWEERGGGEGKVTEESPPPLCSRREQRQQSDSLFSARDARSKNSVHLYCLFVLDFEEGGGGCVSTIHWVFSRMHFLYFYLSRNYEIRPFLWARPCCSSPRETPLNGATHAAWKKGRGGDSRGRFRGMVSPSPLVFPCEFGEKVLSQ